MGIPYSAQINAAFDEVTPLVAAGFDVLRTSRNISILLAAIQVLTALLLWLILLVLIGILVNVSPELTEERRVLVTPAAKWVLGWWMDTTWFWVGTVTLVVGIGLGAAAGWWYSRDYIVRDVSGTASRDEGAEGQDAVEGK